MYNRTIRVFLNGDGTATANFRDSRQITIITNSGTTTRNVIEGYSTSISSGTAPTDYEFDYWEIVSGDVTISNVYSSSTSAYAHSQDSTIRAKYKAIPDFTVTMQNGYIWDGSDWVESATLLRNSTNNIKMKPAPTGYQFLQWEVYESGVLQTNANDVYEPLAEQTHLRNLTRSITIKATYYVPDPEVKYTLTIERKTGTTEQADYAAGTDVNIQASYPDTGMEFYKWTGDTSYVSGGIYDANSYVHMPAQNIRIKENYVPEGYIPGYDLDMTNIYGQCCYTTESEDPNTHEVTTTDHWVSRWSYPEGTTVRVRATGIPNEYYFDAWTAINHSTSADARSIFSNLSLAETTLTMPDYDVDAEPSIALKATYQLRVNDGGTSGYYYEGARADIYFNKVNTNDIHYQFTRWTGTNVSQLELYDGGMFNVLTPGDSNTPQYIKMPAETTEVTATYKTLYRLTLVNGTINSTSATEGYFEWNGQRIGITADAPQQGMRFQRWDGAMADKLANRYDPTTEYITTGGAGAGTLTAVYSNDADRNGTGYVATSLKNSSTVDSSDITVISGTIAQGFLITDTNGHMYIVTNIENTTCSIYRMTKVVQGGNIYG